MQLLQDGVIAALAAVGLATIVWFTVTALTHPRERVRSETAVIVPARGAAEALEHTVRTLENERYASGGFSRIIIADCGMDEDAQREDIAHVEGRLLKLTFTGDATWQPMLGRVARETGIDYTILSGRVDRIKRMPYGQLTLAVTGERFDAAARSFAEAGVHVEELPR